MTVPSLQPSQAWQTIVAAGGSPASTRACVAAAAHLADQLWARVVASPAVDGFTGNAEAAQNAWAHIALTAYEQLRHARAYAHLDAPARLRCIADPSLMHAWLTRSSDLPGFTHHTVAQTWAITDDDFHWESDDITTKLSTLVEQAQRAGVYGVPGYTIGLRHITSGDSDDPVEHQVTLHTPAGAALASYPIPTDHLVDDHLSGVDAAVAALVNTGAIVNELLTDEQRIIVGPLHATYAVPTPPARGFTALDLSTPATVTGIEAAPTAQPKPGHHR